MERMIYSIRRHEKKDGDKLTEQGKLDAVKIGQSLGDKLVCVYHSPKNRAKETAEGIIIGAKGILIPEIIYKSELLNELFPKMPAGIEDKNKIIEYWLEHDYIIGDKKGILYTSGANAVRNIANIIRQAKVVDGGIIENITHAPNVESALITLLDPRMRLKDIGGSFDTGENFIISVEYNNKDLAQIGVKYRGNSKIISRDWFEEIAKNS